LRPWFQKRVRREHFWVKTFAQNNAPVLNYFEKSGAVELKKKSEKPNVKLEIPQ